MSFNHQKRKANTQTANELAPVWASRGQTLSGELQDVAFSIRDTLAKVGHTYTRSANWDRRSLKRLEMAKQAHDLGVIKKKNGTARKDKETIWKERRKRALPWLYPGWSEDKRPLSTVIADLKRKRERAIRDAETTSETPEDHASELTHTQ